MWNSFLHSFIQCIFPCSFSCTWNTCISCISCSILGALLGVDCRSMCCLRYFVLQGFYFVRFRSLYKKDKWHNIIMWSLSSSMHGFFIYARKIYSEFLIPWPRDAFPQLYLLKPTAIPAQIIPLVGSMPFTSGQYKQDSQKITCHTTTNKNKNSCSPKIAKKSSFVLALWRFLFTFGRHTPFLQNERPPKRDEKWCKWLNDGNESGMRGGVKHV